MSFPESERARLEALSARNRQSKSAPTRLKIGLPPVSKMDLCERVAKPPKYRNRHTTVDGIRFDSKAEARVYCELSLAMSNGKLWFIRQPSFDLGGGVKYRADFLVVEGNRVRVIDVKGYDTQASKNKRKQVAAFYGIEVEIIK